MSSLGPTQDHYRTLGVDPASTMEEIRRAYRNLARELHPDRNQQANAAAASVAAERMREVNTAWSVLSNPDAKDLYDLHRRQAAGHPSSVRPTATPTAGGTSAGRAGAAAPGPIDRGVRTSTSDGHPVVRGLLWMVMLGVLAAIFVFTAYAANGPNGQPEGGTTTTQAPLRVGAGDCVDELAGAFDVVACSGPHDARVEAVVALGRPCPAASREVYLPDQQESACLGAP